MSKGKGSRNRGLRKWAGQCWQRERGRDRCLQKGGVEVEYRRVDKRGALKARDLPSWAERGRPSWGEWGVETRALGRGFLRGQGLPGARSVKVSLAPSGESTRKRSCQSTGACREGVCRQRVSRSHHRRQRLPGPRPPTLIASPPLDGQTSRGGRFQGWAQRAGTDSTQR